MSELRRGVSIRRLLLGVNAFVLLVPMLALVLLRIYETHLVRVTERRLIAESVLIGEAWRDRWLEAQGRRPKQAGRTQPTGARGRFHPIQPVLAAGTYAPPEPKREVITPRREGPAWAAGAAIKPLLDRAKLVNLSAARVLDAKGWVVASTGANLGVSLAELPEVRGALSGRYAAVARERHTDSPIPSVGGISRRSAVRVFTATPVFSDDGVIGVVRMSRTSIDPLEALYVHRRTLFMALLGCFLLTVLVSRFLAQRILRPVREITAAAQAIARGDKVAISPEGRVPAEVHDLSAALDSMRAQLSERATWIAEFAANVSHELKTPLTGLRGAAELLRDDWEGMSAEQRERFLGNIDKDAERMQRLVTRLLHLARIESSDVAPEAVPVRTYFQHLAARYEQVWLSLQPLTPETLRINPDHLESAVRNLLDNAVRHGGEAPIELRVAPWREGIEVQVRDQGPGISARNQERIFDRFFTTERDGGGTGLGLAIVQAVARTRGGSITFASGPEGTTFTLRL